MTGLEPGYGETPLPFDELDELLLAAREALPDPPTKADVYDLEQSFELDVQGRLILAVLDEELTLEDVLADHFVRDLHRQMYGDIWRWAGKLRRLEVSIGVPPEQIAVGLRGGLEGLRYRWEHTRDWTAHQLGIAVHAEVVRIHPFVDGNGRSTRLLADLVYLAAQTGDDPAVYDWDLNERRPYIEALQRYDRTRDPLGLAAMIGDRFIEG